MKKQIFKIILISFLVLSFFNTAHAALNIETTVDVPMSCTVTDTDGVAHSYPQVGSSYLAVCALDTAIRNGVVSNTQLSNQFPSLGLFVTTINGVAADPNSQYWAIYQNGSFANSGITSLPVIAGDTITFKLNDFSDNNLGDQVMLHIHSLSTPITTPAGSGPLLTSTNPTTSPTVNSPAITPSEPVKLIFDIKKAFDFLTAQQKSDGTFGEDLYTDWATMALASGNNQDQVLKLVKYLETSKMEGTFLTDYERHAMALMALGLNPYNTNGENYIEKITAQFDGKQFGDANEDNDDIFALIVLQNAEYDIKDKIINDDVSFILNKQKDDGSWDGSVDMTGAGIEALSAFYSMPSVEYRLTKAENFLKQNQKDNGGWNNNASSTAWALEGITALNEKPEAWVKNENTPLDYLASVADTDGGIKDENIKSKIWETAYVVSALSGKTWNQIMQKFEKPKTPIVVEIPKTPVKKISTVKKIIAQTSDKKIENKENKLSKLENLASQNTASAITAVADSPTDEIKPIKKNWFRNLLDKIFSIF